MNEARTCMWIIADVDIFLSLVSFATIKQQLNREKFTVTEWVTNREEEEDAATDEKTIIVF